ncbi:hypothetical protein MC7420_8241 [Coleofasciculus chthonoplastes PCC 7420]|uniref:Uncharacterized protein n=1 Tax=Coleofasciculus chthonoplastes PCC 7420 TaxID=118168 RepID=B4W0V1_9CYAN|nr:hypothetical protein MC7420_8241 [Coleofasciculus chthonoplastes PCC 7420]
MLLLVQDVNKKGEFRYETIIEMRLPVLQARINNKTASPEKRHDLHPL